MGLFGPCVGIEYRLETLRHHPQHCSGMGKGVEHLFRLPVDALQDLDSDFQVAAWWIVRFSSQVRSQTAKGLLTNRLNWFPSHDMLLRYYSPWERPEERKPAIHGATC